MKIIYDNYLEDSTITSSNANESYPIDNVVHKFLVKRYQSTGNSAEVNILFPETRTLSAIAVGFTNATDGVEDEIILSESATDTIELSESATDTILLSLGSEYMVKNAAGTTVAGGSLDVVDGNAFASFDPVQAKSITFFFSADSTLYVGGIGAGDAWAIDHHQANPSFVDLLRGKATKTDGGQPIAKKVRSLREWRVTIDFISNEERLETREMIRDVGNHTPIYASIYDDHEKEPPMRCTITKAGEFPRDTYGRFYSMALTLQEAR